MALSHCDAAAESFTSGLLPYCALNLSKLNPELLNRFDFHFCAPSSLLHITTIASANLFVKKNFAELLIAGLDSGVKKHL
jgi:hypothetical protein